MKNKISYNGQKSIYIPIWLDLLLLGGLFNLGMGIDLHSNMVRFIIKDLSDHQWTSEIFTFQYG